MKTRLERDFIGTVDIPEDALYGIHSFRARSNFPDAAPFSHEWYKAIGEVKGACYRTCLRYNESLRAKFPGSAPPLRMVDDETLQALIVTAEEVASGKYAGQMIIPAVTGGAGTSINMNVNEIIANAALLRLGSRPGNYDRLDPIETANLYQSTNDVVPTALRVAAMRLLSRLETAINESRAAMEKLETGHQHTLRIAYTQLQEAVPSSFGKLFSTYSEALSRDWWRVSKCFERIKLVNLGGGAIGTGTGIPRFFIMEVVQELQRMTGLPVTRSENLADATGNLDSLAEVHAILKAHAVNLEKTASDLRLLASDITGHPQLRLPRKQVGSSIMPGKVNPVIPEFLVSVAHKVYANDSLITGLCGQGMLELNAYLPVIGDALLNSLELLIAANHSLRENLLNDLIISHESAYARLLSSPAITTALSVAVGYHRAAELAALMKKERIDVLEGNRRLGLLSGSQLESLLRPENLLKLGFTLQDFQSFNREEP